MKYYVYVILDTFSKKVKIGKANDVETRLRDLQIGNPNLLEVINTIECKTEKEAYFLESILHDRFKDIHVLGEWFHFIPEFQLKDFLDIKVTERRDPLVIESLYGTHTVRDINEFPRCYFYPWLVAQIKHNYEKSLRLKLPFRTMKFPTNGKQLLLPYSIEIDRVFISGKKHFENLELKRFEEKQNKNDWFKEEEEIIVEESSGSLENHFGA